MSRAAVALAFRAAHRLAATAPLGRRLLRKALVVFLYHEVSDQPSEFNRMFNLNVRPAAFARQVDLIRRLFRVIGPEELLAGEVETPAALITFDDGNRSYVEDALPILKERGVPSVAFLNMGPVQGEVCWSGLVTYLQHQEPGFRRGREGLPASPHAFHEITEEEVSRYLQTVDQEALLARVRAFRGRIVTPVELDAVRQERLVWLGNHLYHHYNSAAVSAQKLREAYRSNQELLDRHPRGTRLFSYPFGQPERCFTAGTTELIRAEGASALFSSVGLPNFNRHPEVYNRIAPEEGVATEQALVEAVLREYVADKGRRLAAAVLG